MACELCEHCQSPVCRDDKITIREGFSYHKRCHKCYVCSETNLLNAEVFKGVIFCSACAQKIFQGCSTARRTKNLNAGRGRRNRSKSGRRTRSKSGRRTRSKSHRHERERVRGHDKKIDNSRDGVIELARLVGSNTDSDDQQEQKQKEPSTIAVSDHTLEVERNKHVETVDHMKKDKQEMGTITDVTQELLKKINNIVPELCEERSKVKPCTPPKKVHRRRNRKRESRESRKKPSCSDFRIADKSGEGSDWTDSAYSTIDESETSGRVMDRRLGSILKMPIKLFKKNILNRSSLVSVLMSVEDGRSVNLIRKIKQILHEEVVEHQVRGVKRLYSTINRRKTPYKLGWVGLVAKVSRDSNFCTCSYGKRCKHFRNSHSYRCMRAQVMKLAGPTISELAVYRNKIKRFIAPQFLRNMLTYKTPNPTPKISAACQKSCSHKS